MFGLNILKNFKKLDVYKKLPADLTTSTTTGAISLSLTSFIFSVPSCWFALYLRISRVSQDKS